MRIIQAFTLQRTGFDAASGILDWMLSPYYAKRAYPKHTLVLYTNQKSVELLGELWPYIAKQYDEVHTDLIRGIEYIFSMPKFEAMERELRHHGPDFVMIDNDMYLFVGALSKISDYCIYYDDSHLMNWYKAIVSNQYGVLNAPSWMQWTAIPYNCAIIRINNDQLLSEYISLFYQVKAENLKCITRKNPLEHTMVKEQWVLGEFFEHYNIKPEYIKNRHKSLHKGCIKPFARPTQLIALQEYLASWLIPEAYKVYKKVYNFDIPNYDINWCLDTLLQPYEKEGLLEPVKEKQKKCV